MGRGGGTLQNFRSELRSHTGDCSTAVTLSAGILVPNSVISAAHIAVQSSAPAPGNTPETPTPPWRVRGSAKC